MSMTNPLSFFQWGAAGKALTPDELQKMRLLEAQRAAQGDTRPADVPSQGLARVAEALAGSVRRGQLDAQAEELAAHDQSRIASWGGPSSAGSGAAVPAPDVAALLTAQPAAENTGSTYEPFMQTVQQSGVSNPYALAAIAATGQAESGFSPANANRTWSDPSQSGQPGTAGGIMSWRNDRLNNLLGYAAQNGEQPGAVSPQTQAQFFLQENPQLIEQLNNARSVDEAQGLMNNAWRFAGYNQPGGEADRRLQIARALLPQFQGGQTTQGQQMAMAQPQASRGYNSQALLDTSLDPRVSEQTRTVAQALLKQQQAQDAAAQQMQQRQMAAQSAGIDPRFAADDELWKQAAAAQFRDPSTATVGNVVIDTRTGQPIYTGQQQLPTSAQEYEYGLRNPGYFEQQERLRRSAASQVNVGAGEKTWDVEDAKAWNKRYQGYQDAAANAQNMINLYDLAEKALDTGVRTGWGGETELTIRQLGQAIGLSEDDKKLAGGELVRAVQNRMALIMRSPESGMGMPGALSEKDLQFLKDSQIGIDRSPEGNRQMLAAFRKMEERKVQIAQLADDYIKQNGKLNFEFNQVVRDFAEANPLFPEVPEGESDAPLAEGVTESGHKFTIRRR